ncbi:hypothetical protein HHI36_011171 [Cryptolaemus montrouzieri]|uniref:Uncharacterized protein n=1 Tax=Cryptolaemus montrouzieri TaxID=559131 RepID=A0ABD2MKZ7_9CUCU
MPIEYRTKQAAPTYGIKRAASQNHSNYNLVFSDLHRETYESNPNITSSFRRRLKNYATELDIHIPELLDANNSTIPPWITSPTQINREFNKFETNHRIIHNTFRKIEDENQDALFIYTNASSNDKGRTVGLLIVSPNHTIKFEIKNNNIFIGEMLAIHHAFLEILSNQEPQS